MRRSRAELLALYGPPLLPKKKPRAIRRVPEDIQEMHRENRRRVAIQNERRREQAAIDAVCKRLSLAYEEMLDDGEPLWSIDPRSPTAWAELLAVPVRARVLCMRLLPWQSCPVYRIVRAVYPEGATLDALGEAYGLTRERARQLEYESLAHLRETRGLVEWRDYASDLCTNEVMQ